MLEGTRWWKLLWVYLNDLLLSVSACASAYLSICVHCVFVSLKIISACVSVCVWIWFKSLLPGACVCVWLNVCHTSHHLHNSRRRASKHAFFPSTPRCEFLTFTRPEGNSEWERSAQVCYVSPALLFTALSCALQRRVCLCASNSWLLFLKCCQNECK